MVDVAKRLCTDANIPVAEIHTYHWIGDEMRFLPAYKAPSDGKGASTKARDEVPSKAPAKKRSPSRPNLHHVSHAAKSSRKTGRSPKRK